MTIFSGFYFIIVIFFIKKETKLFEINLLKECATRGCSLIVKDNNFSGLSFPRLSEISRGDVIFGDNPNLCYFHNQARSISRRNFSNRQLKRQYCSVIPLTERVFDLRQTDWDSLFGLKSKQKPHWLDSRSKKCKGCHGCQGK